MGLLACSANAQLINPGFETDNASTDDVAGATGWSGFNSRFTTATQAHSGTQSLKIFGPFEQFGGAGAFQDIPAIAGTTYTASAWALNSSADPMQGANFGLVQLIFLDAADATIGSAFASAPFNASNSTPNVWTELIATGIAPAGTVEARIQLLHVQMNNPVTGGSIFFDDASLAIPEPGIGMAGLALLVGVALRRRGRHC
jgi:hypothetical protein